KRRKLSEEAQEAEDLRKRLEIVQDEDDAVFVEATPLAQKVHKTTASGISARMMVEHILHKAKDQE
nr:hypothetical protein [Tanacetum cinerariifolium]